MEARGSGYRGEKGKEIEAQVATGEPWDNRYYLAIEIGTKRCRALYDPGATCSLIWPALTKYFDKLLRPSNSSIRAFDGGTSKVKGILQVTFEIDGRRVRIDFKAAEAITQEMLLGADCEIAYDI